LDAIGREVTRKSKTPLDADVCRLGGSEKAQYIFISASGRELLALVEPGHNRKSTTVGEKRETKKSRAEDGRRGGGDRLLLLPIRKEKRKGNCYFLLGAMERKRK